MPRSYNPQFPSGYAPQFPTEDGGALALVSAVIQPDGLVLILVFSAPVSFGAGGNGGFALTASGGASTATYASGSGSDTLRYSLSRAVARSETVTLAYTQPGNGVEDGDGADLSSFSGTAVTVSVASLYNLLHRRRRRS